MLTRIRFFAASLGIITLTIATDDASAKDHFLTIGGGYSPASNQVSLEKNVLFFKRLLSERYPDGASHEIYFADGNSPLPDVQFEPRHDHTPEANRLMARFLGDEDNLGYEYRDNTLRPVNGISSPENIAAWFRRAREQTKRGDRVVIYVTAHGGRSRDRKAPYNTKLHLWDNRDIDVAQLAGHIESLPAGVEVVLIMVQCYSGGFSHLLFKDGDQRKGLGNRIVAGFFATVHDRVAAGCTPDISEKNYQEYSSSFWAAIRGRTRLDQPVTGADYDNDGNVSFEEAHFFTVLQSTTIDIPIRTSDAFLRQFSRLKDKEHPELMAMTAPFSELLAKARPTERLALEELSEKLKLTGDARVARATGKAAQLDKEHKDFERRIREQKSELRKLRSKISSHLKKKWPDLYADFSPTTIRLLTTDANEFVRTVKTHPDFPAYERKERELFAMEDKDFQVEKHWVQYQRFLRTLESVALAANLAKSTDKNIVARYESLLKAETGVLPRPPIPVSHPVNAR